MNGCQHGQSDSLLKRKEAGMPPSFSAGNRRHDLRHDDAGSVARSQQRQLAGKRGAADARYVGINHAGKEVARLLNELGGGPIGGGHDHRLDREFL